VNQIPAAESRYIITEPQRISFIKEKKSGINVPLVDAKVHS
jgi:hypothetical protein